MTLKLHENFIKSLPFAFEKVLEDYRMALLEHHFKPVDPVTGEGPPPPVAPHPFVEHALRRIPGDVGDPDDYVPDYVIIKDDPPPAPTLDERRAALAHEVHQKEMAARHEVLPRHRERLIARADHEVANIPAHQHTATHVAYLADRDVRRAKLDAIDLWAAKALAEVGELDEVQLNEGYTLPALPV